MCWELIFIKIAYLALGVQVLCLSNLFPRPSSFPLQAAKAGQATKNWAGPGNEAVVFKPDNLVCVCVTMYDNVCIIMYIPCVDSQLQVHVSIQAWGLLAGY